MYHSFLIHSSADGPLGCFHDRGPFLVWKCPPQSRTAPGSCPRKVLRSSIDDDNPKHEAVDLKKCSHLQGSNEDEDINRLVDTAGGEGRRNGESNIENKDVTTCKVDSQWEFAIWLRELKLWPCDNLEGWEMGGRGHVCTYG